MIGGITLQSAEMKYVHKNNKNNAKYDRVVHEMGIPLGPFMKGVSFRNERSSKILSEEVSLLILTLGIQTSRKLEITTNVSITSPELMNI